MYQPGPPINQMGGQPMPDVPPQQYQPQPYVPNDGAKPNPDQMPSYGLPVQDPSINPSVVMPQDQTQ